MEGQPQLDGSDHSPPVPATFAPQPPHNDPNPPFPEPQPAPPPSLPPFVMTAVGGKLRRGPACLSCVVEAPPDVALTNDDCKRLLMRFARVNPYREGFVNFSELTPFRVAIEPGDDGVARYRLSFVTKIVDPLYRLCTCNCHRHKGQSCACPPCGHKLYWITQVLFRGPAGDDSKLYVVKHNPLLELRGRKRKNRRRQPSIEGSDHTSGDPGLRDGEHNDSHTDQTSQSSHYHHNHNPNNKLSRRHSEPFPKRFCGGLLVDPNTPTRQPDGGNNEVARGDDNF